MNLPDSGNIVDVRECVAIVSGLGDAGVGSIVAISHENCDVEWYGVVMYTGKRSAHIALIPAVWNKCSGAKRVPVSIGMEAKVVPGQFVLILPENGSVHFVSDLIKAPENSQKDTSVSTSLPFFMGSKCVPSFMSRRPLHTPFRTGVLAIDCFQPLACGHRLGVFGPLHSGKSELMLEIIVNHVNECKERGIQPPHFVYVCVGQNAHRIRRISKAFEDANVSMHTTIVATSNYDALMLQYLTPFIGCMVAERHKAPKTVVVYDDLAMHSTITEQLIQLIELPRSALSIFDGVAILMERSGRFEVNGSERSMTTFALATSGRETAEMHERLRSLVDDVVSIPNDVVLPGKSIRGAPFQIKGLWRWNQRVRARINSIARKAASMDEARQLGIEPEGSHIMEYQQLVREFFTQKAVLEKERILLGVMFLAIVEMDRLPSPFRISSFLDKAMAALMHSDTLGKQLEVALAAGDWTTSLDQALIAFLKQQIE